MTEPDDTMSRHTEGVKVGRVSGAFPAWAGLAGLVLWLAFPNPWLLLVPFLAGLWVLKSTPRPFHSFLVALIVLLGCIAASSLHYRLHRITSDWDQYWTSRSAWAEEELRVMLEDVTGSALRAIEEASELELPESVAPLEDALVAIRRRAGLAALAIYDSDGELVVWDGEHRGKVPPEVRSGLRSVAYREGPLFRYQYFSTPMLGTSRVAVAAVLMQAELPAELEADLDDFRSQFFRATGETIDVLRAPPFGIEEGLVEWASENEVLSYVRVNQPSQSEVVRREVRLWSRILLGLIVACWLILVLRADGRRSEVWWAASLGLLVAGFVPFASIFDVPELFQPAAFLSVVGIPLTLGRLMGLSLVSIFLVGFAFSPAKRPRRILTASTFAVAGFCGVSLFMHASVNPNFLVGSTGGWFAYQVTLSALFVLVLTACIRLGVGGDRGRPWMLLTAILIAVGLGVAVVFLTRFNGMSPWWIAGMWGVPVGLFLGGMGRRSWWNRSIVIWGVSTFLAVSAALSIAWSKRVEAQIQAGTLHLEELDNTVDPYLTFLLGRFAGVVEEQYEAWFRNQPGDPVKLLYQGWKDSRLAEARYPVQLTLWSALNEPQEELDIGGASRSFAVRPALLDQARTGGRGLVRERSEEEPYHLAIVPLRDGSVITALVPSPVNVQLSPISSPVFGLTMAGDQASITIVPLREGDTLEAGPLVEWEPNAEGWHGDRSVTDPTGRYDAHYQVGVVGPMVLIARTTLIIALGGTIIILLWGLGKLLAPTRTFSIRSWFTYLGSFRARVTLALFAFFFLSIAIFGTLAFGTLSNAAVRASTLLAERIIQEGIASYRDAGGSMVELARELGAEVIEYREGGLREGSQEELVELGIYEGWLPLGIFRQLDGRETLRVSSTSSIGNWKYGVAFGRLPDGDVLASYVPLQEGAAAVGSAEVRDLLGFAILVGGLLSLGLALLVARMLTRPIQVLRIASERVGTGNLRVKLPEGRPDEFGAVFSAFNRMVNGVRQARRALLRTTRRTQAIVNEAAAGVIALDADGCVTLVNPKAKNLIGESLRVGEPMRKTGLAEADALVDWVELYRVGGLRESGADLQFGERRIRVRGSRISEREPEGGLVLILEDVTDELRSERILAWGEMARQVAHEVKNPLTPMKLSIQHIQRAWDDRKGDFDQVLTRNVEAVLSEIDRLDSIARGFSRLGTPSAAPQQPLEEVVLHEVVGEVLDLYRGGGGEIEFRNRIAEHLGPVWARKSELKEVLLNLFENSRTAIGIKGVVTVDARPAGSLIELRIEDDGGGIPASVLNRIFEPQFSTHSGGTGLGLAIVRRLVESWDGMVSAESQEGKGTVIKLHLRKATLEVQG